MNGIGFYGRGVARDRIRDRLRQFEEVGGGERGDGSITLSGGEDRLVDDRDAVRAFEEAWALEMLNAAHELVHADLAARGKLDEYDVFRRHVIDGVEYAVIGADLGLTRQQCANMVRRVSERVRESLRQVVCGEGVAAEDVERTVREIEDLLGAGDALARACAGGSWIARADAGTNRTRADDGTAATDRPGWRTTVAGVDGRQPGER
jgi:hypothetical protein